MKNIFANCIIAICLFVTGVITAGVLWEYHRLNTVIPAPVLTALISFWGGELLVIALRQIFGSDVIIKAKTAAKKPIDDYDSEI